MSDEATDVPRKLPIEEFSSEGYMAEVNRRILHPLGLALERSTGWSEDDVAQLVDELELGALISESPLSVSDTPELVARAVLLRFLRHVGLTASHLTGVWDCRSDPEGIYYGPAHAEIVSQAAANVDRLWSERQNARVEALGYMIQPADG